LAADAHLSSSVRAANRPGFLFTPTLHAEIDPFKVYLRLLLCDEPHELVTEAYGFVTQVTPVCKMCHAGVARGSAWGAGTDGPDLSRGVGLWRFLSGAAHPTRPGHRSCEPQDL